MEFVDIMTELESNKENHTNGYFNCIPLKDFNRLERLIPGIEQDTYYLLTASSGVGKSKLARSLFIHTPYNFVRENPDYDIKLDIFYFSLEESKKKVILSEISKYMYKEHGKVFSIKQLQSRGRYNTIDSESLAQIRAAGDYIDDFQKVVRIIDNVRKPSTIFNHMKKFAVEIGSYYDKDGVELTEAEHQDILRGGKSVSKIHTYQKHHPRHFVIVLVDHISLLETEKDEMGRSMNQWDTMGTFSKQYCISLRDKYGFIPVVVQQQASAKEQVEYNYKGATIQEKLEPSLDGLGDNKTTQRDANVVFGLFAPYRYRIEEHEGYPITEFRDNYRSLSILKDRDGESNGKLPLYFNGAIDHFSELPKPDDIEKINDVLSEIILNRQNK